MRLPALKAYPEYYVVVAIFASALPAAALYFPHLFLHLFGLWFLPLFTVTPVLHKIRSFAEHTGNHQDPTFTWRPGLAGRLTIWPYNIAYHQEHHRNPSLAWHQLPSVGSELLRWLWTGRI